MAPHSSPPAWRTPGTGEPAGLQPVREGDGAPLHRGEAKDSALLSSRDAGLLEPPERPQGSPPVPGVLQAGGLEWGAIAFSHGLQPTRLPRPWNSPGKNTGVGCHFLLQCMKVKSESEVAQSCPTLRDPMDCSASLGFSRQEDWSGAPSPSRMGCSPAGSPVPGVLQAGGLEWVARSEGAHV